MANTLNRSYRHPDGINDPNNPPQDITELATDVDADVQGLFVSYMRRETFALVPSTTLWGSIGGTTYELPMGHRQGKRRWLAGHLQNNGTGVPVGGAAFAAGTEYQLLNAMPAGDRPAKAVDLVVAVNLGAVARAQVRTDGTVWVALAAGGTYTPGQLRVGLASIAWDVP